MEPAAPGTEDEVPFTAGLNKQANEQERLLSLKAFLPNGQYGKVFDLSFVNGCEHWFCNACKCPVMGRVYQHELGKRHCVNMSKGHQKEGDHRSVQAAKEEPPQALQIAPGEPLPPGFEGQVEEITHIQEKLDNFKATPLVALEYLLEMQYYDPSKESYYLCVLCDKKGDPRTVLTHLSSYNHIQQYLQKHFPTCFRKLAPYMTKQYKRAWQRVLVNIAEAIEQKFGRLKPIPIEKDKFDADMTHYLSIICKSRHFSEKSGYTFEELVTHEELTKVYYESEPITEPTMAPGVTTIMKPFKKRSPSPPVVARPTKKVKPPVTSGSFSQKSAQTSAPKPEFQRGRPVGSNAGQDKWERRRSLSSVSSISSSDLSDKEGGGRNVDRQQQQKKFRGKLHSPPKTFQRRNENVDKKGSVMPWQRPNYIRRADKIREDSSDKNRENKNDKLDEYKKLSKAIETDMGKTLLHHEKNPEKHPQYNEEWKKFWNRRYKELQSEGKDAANHDFKPEWIQFWNKRMIELHQDEMKNRKDALRKRLALPEEPAPICFRITGKGKFEGGKDSPNNKPLPMAARPDEDLDNEVIFIDDDKYNKTREEKDKYGRSQRSQSPWESEPAVKTVITKEKSLDRGQRDISPRGRRPKDVSPRDRRPRDISPRDRRLKDFSPRNRRVKEISPYGRSRSKERYSVRSHSRDRSRDMRSRSRSRDASREKAPDSYRDYRESSFERDVRGKERIRTVADLPWERQKYYDDYYKPPSIMRDVTRKPVMLPPVRNAIPTISIDDDEDEDEEVNIVAVLRLLTAVEERLGSLGPKIIDLLAQALAMEKHEANSSEKLLDNDMNCVLFETVKEKLKGQLLAGFVDHIQERAFKKAIKKTASLIHLAGKRNEMKSKLTTKVGPVSVPGVGTVDKAAIARQIASALIAQGKTDVTQDQLEQLINAVVGMAEASKKAGKPISTASFLDRLSGAAPVEEQKKSPVVVVKPEEKVEVVSLEKITEPLTPSPKSSNHNMDHLSDSDLQTLLQNFKDLQTEEQHGLINYLKKLETHEPERVERLRKFVNLKTGSDNVEGKPKSEVKPIELKDTEDIDDFEDEEEEKTNTSGRQSPFSNRLGGLNPTADEKRKEQPKIQLDSEDEDYTFEDVVKAVSKNVKAKELEKERQIVEESMKKTKDVELDTKSIISNLMSNINKSKTTSTDLGSSSSNSTSVTSTIASSSDFTTNLSNFPINMANIASIVGNAHKMMQDQKKKDEFKEDFPPVSQENRLNIDLNTLASSSSSKPRIIQNIVLNRIDRSNNQPNNPNLGPSRPNFEPNRPDLMPARPVAPGGHMASGGSNMAQGGQNMGPGYQKNMNLGDQNMGPGGMNRGMSPNIPRMGGPPNVRPMGMNLNRPPMGGGGGPNGHPSRGNYQMNNPYGGNNFQPNNYPSQQNPAYPNVRGNAPFDQRPRFNNPRFQGNQYNNRPSGNYNNRW